MKLRFSQASACAAGSSAVVTRVFYGLMLDSPDVHNGAWLSVIIGAALALPVLWLIRRVICFSNDNPHGIVPRRILALLLLLFLLADISNALRLTAFSASYTAFDHVPMQFLVIPLLLAALRCVFLGGDAVGSGARVWLYVFAVLMLFVAILQVPRFKPGWLAPILGFGVRGIAAGGLRAAGWMSVLLGGSMLLCASGQVPEMKRVIVNLLLASATAIALIALRLMLAPVPDAAGMQRTPQLDALLTNGRSTLYLQLPMIIIWFIGMLNLVAVESILTAGMLKLASARLSEKLCIVIAFLLIIAAMYSGFIESLIPSAVMDHQLLWIAAAAAIGALSTVIVKGGGPKCDIPH